MTPICTAVDDPLEQALHNGELWRSFCDGLKAAGERILADSAPSDPLTRAEGFRYLTRLLRLGLEKNLEFDNPHYPQFYSLSHESAKIGNDNPDNYYLNCAIDGSSEYRVIGNCGTVEYLSLETKAGSFAGGDMAPTGHIDLTDLVTDAGGNFELVVSAREQRGNWLPMTSASDNLLVRQTFRDRNSETPARLHIECLAPRGSAALDPVHFARQLQQVVPFVTGTAGLFSSWMELFASHVNQLPANDQQMCQQAGGDPAIFYHNSYWRLGQDEALVIEFTPPRECQTWNFQLSNYWMESLDYRYFPVCINKHSAQRNRDGSVTLVVAHADPGCANWLSTAGHEVGAMLLRYVDASEHPPVTTRVVAVAEFSEAAGVS